MNITWAQALEHHVRTTSAQTFSPHNSVSFEAAIMMESDNYLRYRYYNYRYSMCFSEVASSLLFLLCIWQTDRLSANRHTWADTCCGTYRHVKYITLYSQLQVELSPFHIGYIHPRVSDDKTVYRRLYPDS